LFQSDDPSDGCGTAVVATTQVEPSDVKETVGAQTQTGTPPEDAEADVETENAEA
jgi:hypothetical protein